MALTDDLTLIANAIRNKTGKPGKLTLRQMATEISNIQSGSDDENPCRLEIILCGNEGDWSIYDVMFSCLTIWGDQWANLTESGEFHGGAWLEDIPMGKPVFVQLWSNSLDGVDASCMGCSVQMTVDEMSGLVWAMVTPESSECKIEFTPLI